MAAFVTCPVQSCCSIISSTVPTYIFYLPHTLCGPCTVTPSRTAPGSSRPICSSPYLTPLVRFLFGLSSSSSPRCYLSGGSCSSSSRPRLLLSLSLPSPVPPPLSRRSLFLHPHSPALRPPPPPPPLLPLLCPPLIPAALPPPAPAPGLPHPAPGLPLRLPAPPHPRPPL